MSIRGLFVLIFIVGMSNCIYAMNWQVTQLTDNTADDWQCRVSNGNVSWIGGANSSVHFFDGHEIQEISPSHYNGGLYMSGRKVAWNCASDVYYFDGSQTHNLTAGVDDWCQCWGVSDAYVAWTEKRDIYLHDGESLYQLTNDQIPKQNLVVSGDHVSWAANISYPSDGDDIFHYDGNVINQISNNNAMISYVDMYDARIVWQSFYIEAGNVFFDLLMSNEGSVVTLDDHVETLPYPSLSGQLVAWEAQDSDSGLNIIKYYDGIESCNLGRGRDPQVSGALIAYVGYSNVTHDYNVCLFDGEDVHQLTYGQRVRNPQIDGTTLVWEAWDGNDYEVFMATPLPEPGGLLWLGSAFLLVRKRRGLSI